MNAELGLQSWGQFPIARNQTAVSVGDGVHPFEADKLYLPRGLGRSYGDSCLNDYGVLLLTKGLAHFIHFDQHTGILVAEAGVTLEDILKVFVPKSWFLPVTPGTKFVTLGGAIANDVHGKNHHLAGSFGNYVRSMKVLRSNGELIDCSERQNPEFFRATIGGLGLTGLILQAEIQLKKIETSYIQQTQTKFRSVEEYRELTYENRSREYTVAWVDCVSGQDLRGVFIAGDHCSKRDLLGLKANQDMLRIHSGLKLQMPITMPQWLLNPLSIKIFNQLYFHKSIHQQSSGLVHYDPFFYPLDSIGSWNNMYGRRGFLQYQFVVPDTAPGAIAINRILKLIKKSKFGSFLAVLKNFGSIPSRGLMSFPREGITLALDFPNYGQPLLKLLEACDEQVTGVGGAIYPAKDARMSALTFQKSFSKVDDFKKFIDPQFSSSFWRRM